MLTLQEQFEIDYPNKFVQKIDADKKYPRLIFANYDLDLNEYKNLKDLSLGSNQINSLNISQLSNLTLINLHNCPLTSLKLPPGLIIKMWNMKIWEWAEPIKSEISYFGLDELIDTSDLDNWVKNYDESKTGNEEYHKICGSKNIDINYRHIEWTALFNLGGKVIARKLIILSRLLTPPQDLPKNKPYEDELLNLAEDRRKITKMKLITNDLSKHRIQIVINQALSGDKELLAKLQDLPYLKTKFLFNSRLSFQHLKTKLQQIQSELTTTIEKKQKLQVESQARIQELTLALNKAKDDQQLANDLLQTKTQKYEQLQTAIENKNQTAIDLHQQTFTDLTNQNTKINTRKTQLEEQLELKNTELIQTQADLNDLKIKYGISNIEQTLQTIIPGYETLIEDKNLFTTAFNQAQSWLDELTTTIALHKTAWEKNLDPEFLKRVTNFYEDLEKTETAIKEKQIILTQIQELADKNNSLLSNLNYSVLALIIIFINFLFFLILSFFKRANKTIVTYNTTPLTPITTIKSSPTSLKIHNPNCLNNPQKIK